MKLFKNKFSLNMALPIILLMISKPGFASLTGNAKYLGPVIQFFNDFRLELIIVLTAIAALIIIWLIWENMTDQNMPNMWKRIGMVAIIYVVTLKVPDVIVALGGATVDLENLGAILKSAGV